MSLDTPGKRNQPTEPQPSVRSRPEIVALFDFDGTLTHCDSLLPFLRFAVGRVRFWSGFLSLASPILSYGLGRIDRTRLKEAVLGCYIGGWTAGQLQTAIEKFTTTILPSLCKNEAIARIHWHKERGHRIIVISASPEAYLKPWAENLPIDAVLATRIDIRDGIVSGQIDGKNCRGAEKVARLKQYLSGLDEKEIYAYGDSAGDREMLAIADHANYRPFRCRGAAFTSKIRFLKALL